MKEWMKIEKPPWNKYKFQGEEGDEFRMKNSKIGQNWV
jgi:hypothetical protein